MKRHIIDSHYRPIECELTHEQRREIRAEQSRIRSRRYIIALFVILVLTVAVLVWAGNVTRERMDVLTSDADRRDAEIAQIADWCEDRGIEVGGMEVYR